MKPGFPEPKDLQSLARAQAKVDERLSKMEQGLISTTKQEGVVLKQILASMIEATRAGFPSRHRPTVVVVIEIKASFAANSCPVMTENVYNQLRSGQQEVRLNYQDFLALSPRERGSLWQPMPLARP